MDNQETKAQEKQDKNPFHRDGCSCFRCSGIAWNKGKRYHFHIKRVGPKWSEERKEARRQQFNSPEMRLKLRKGRLGKKYSIEYKENMSAVAKSKGFGKWMKGKKHKPETLEKISIANRGEKSSFWQGGLMDTSPDNYPRVFNKQLKERIRVRDNFICKLCGIPELECSERHSIHHIDYNKKNCDENNLVLLCRSCHGKTNINRKGWIEFFNPSNNLCQTK